MSLADIGCGNGYFTLPTAQIVEGAPVYAIDVDGTHLNEIAATAEARGMSNITCIQGDARELATHLPAPVDSVLISNTSHGVEDKQNLAAQATQSLRPGGRFIIVNWHDLPREETTVVGEPRGPPEEVRVAVADTRAAVAAIEFSNTTVLDLPPYHYAFICER